MDTKFWTLQIVLLLLLLGYVCHLLCLGRLILLEYKKRVWNSGWFILAFFPLVGWYIFTKVKKAASETILLDMSDTDPSQNLAEYHNVEWILFQEQYDRKSGDHQGTRFHLLTEPEYDIVSYTYEIDTDDQVQDNDAKEIVIPYPGKVVRLDAERFLWATLTHTNGSWQIYNEREHSIIPIYNTKESDLLEEGSVNICKHNDSRYPILKNGQYFIVHTTEFCIFRLPKLALFKITSFGDKVFIGGISGAPIFLDQNGDVVSELPNSFFISIEGCKVIVNKPIDYQSVFLPKKHLVEGYYTLPLYPGDLFQMLELPISLMVDYDLTP